MEKITVGILAHVDSGKTTLSEAMLYLSGCINTLGRVDKKNSFLDTFSLERSRGITIFSKQAVFEYNNTEFTLIDTPGHTDFSAETERTLQILDYAILVVSATDDVQGHTKTLWRLLEKYNIPCFIFINKMDLDGADKEVAENRLKAKLSEFCVDFGNETNEEFKENIALCNDKLLAEYESGTLNRTSISNAVKNREIFPYLCGSALKLDGVEALLNCIDNYSEINQYPLEFGAKVFKITEDKGQRLTHLKVTGGILKVKQILESDKNTDSEKVNQIRIYSGEKFKSFDEVEAGTICAVTGINFAKSGDGLGIERNSPIPIIEPVLTYSLHTDDNIDAHTLLDKMKILENEEPQLKVEWNERYSEIQLKLMGNIQLEILQSIIKERFGINAKFGKGKIIYKETIKDQIEGIGHFEPLRHYAEVHLLMKPLSAGSGLIFKTDCKEDLLDKNWQRLILTHLYEKVHLGVLTGSPITDMEIILKSGKAHPKHTEGGDFRQATYRAVRQGLRSAESILLEPIYNFTLEIPTENVGKAISDIQYMHGNFDTPQTEGETTVITGSAPAATMCDYSEEVINYTHGKGKLTCIFSGYEPCHNTEEVVKEMGYDCESDTANPCDSVFCSHGAGYTVKWDQVKSHMHLPSALSTPKSEYISKPIGKKANYRKTADDLFALDKELMEIFEQTYGPIKRNNKTKEHFTFTKKSDDKQTKKYPPAPKYDGKEYLLVDGYNVIFSWKHLRELSENNIDGAKNALINTLCNYNGYKKCEVILVFDAYKVKGNTRETEKINNISVVYTKEAETADMYIEKVTHSLAKKNNKVRVVTSDGLEQIIILGNGALRVSTNEFLEEVKQAEENIRNIIEQRQY